MKASDTTDGKFALYSYNGDYWVLPSNYIARGFEVLATGTYEEMSALHKLMYAAHANN